MLTLKGSRLSVFQEIVIFLILEIERQRVIWMFATFWILDAHTEPVGQRHSVLPICNYIS